ncbi:zinc finger CCCH domain-containing protein 18-like [Punica granatum]|uniref:Uncharacterized protein n=2 Tax=Punica granatum TaxID=22663 RepID=A0A218Y356_PUNGR|nr:zinc finger CCCH domain-containing protein 18-like [Punica granatum]OWM91269.1 hypothetical protein CDL15_Pgr000213 [Punica granatum]PKI61575.1 hypothetical protein CRG98_018071 [Punica granatum]
MGCCESTTRQAAASLLQPLPASDQIKGASVVEVEEKVKEVLCETPAALKPVTPPVTMKPQEPLQNHEPPPHKIGQAQPPPPTATPSLSEKSMPVPEPSKVRGLSERNSSTPASLAGSGEAKQRAERSPVKPRPTRTRSLSGDLSTSMARGTGRSPTRIRPDGIGGSVRIVQSREATWSQRFDPGERSGRRSGPGSPAKRASINAGTRSAVDRIPSMRKMDLSPGRVRRDPNASSKRSMNGGDPKQRQSKGRESLESPLVSLECFIFL